MTKPKVINAFKYIQITMTYIIYILEIHYCYWLTGNGKTKS